MYKVSLAIPIYNVSLFVERALLSVLNQTYDNIEYLIVDDKGQDDSMDRVRGTICRKLQKRNRTASNLWANGTCICTNQTAVQDFR